MQLKKCNIITSYALTLNPTDVVFVLTKMSLKQLSDILQGNRSVYTSRTYYCLSSKYLSCCERFHTKRELSVPELDHFRGKYPQKLF